MAVLWGLRVKIYLILLVFIYYSDAVAIIIVFRCEILYI